MRRLDVDQRLNPLTVWTMTRLIFGPSGAGKTYLTSRFPSIFIDGDTVIADKIGWPDGRWWETMSSPEKDVFAAQVDKALLSVDSNKTILFTPDVKRTSIIPYAVFLPSRSTLVRNMASKFRQGIVNQPNSAAEAYRAHEEWSKYFQDLPSDVEIFSSAEELVSFVSEGGNTHSFFLPTFSRSDDD